MLLISDTEDLENAIGFVDAMDFAKNGWIKIFEGGGVNELQAIREAQDCAREVTPQLMATLMDFAQTPGCCIPGWTVESLQEEIRAPLQEINALNNLEKFADLFIEKVLGKEFSEDPEFMADVIHERERQIAEAQEAKAYADAFLATSKPRNA